MRRIAAEYARIEEDAFTVSRDAVTIGDPDGFAADAGDTLPRNCDGAGGLHYREHSGRNDLVTLKVARDADKIFFYARTRQTLTPSADPNWMWLLIDTDSNPRTGWEGYDFIVNHRFDGDGTTWLKKNDGGWRWKPVAKVGLPVANGQKTTLSRRATRARRSACGGVTVPFKVDFGTVSSRCI